MRPPVTIVLPTFNDSHFLVKAIPSCLQQEVEKEIIIVDDGSSKELDPTVALMIGQFGIKYIKHEKNGGLSASRNTGISQAKHEWIVPLDADDYFYPGALASLLDNVESSDVVYGNVTDSGLTHYPIREKLTKEHFIQGNPLFCSSVFRKDVWAKVGGYMVRNGPHYEDWNFWARVFKGGGRFKYVDFTVYEHTSRPDGMLRILHPNRDFYRKLAVEGVF